MQFALSRSLAAVAAAAVFTAPALAGGEGWTDDYAQAQATAAQESKDLLLDFTGSDWCHWCQILDQEVFAQDAFQAYAPLNFVLVELDFPRQSQLSEEVAAQNAELAERFAVQGYPTIILADAQGRAYAQTGYQAGGADAYVQHLESLKAIRVERDQKMAAADEAQGLEKAQLLHEAMQVLGDEMAVQYYAPVVEQIMALDADNAAGLKGHYELLALAEAQRMALAEVMASDVEADPQGVISKLDALLADELLVASTRQEALAIKSQILFFILEDLENAKAALEQAIAVDPESEVGQMLQGALEQFFGPGAQ